MRTISENVEVGKSYGRWTVLNKEKSRVYISGGKAREVKMLRCRCACGVEKVVIGSELKKGRSQSCGCLRKEIVSILATKHGEIANGKESPEYAAWRGIISRCTNKKNTNYQKYGGRGITVTNRWMIFKNFLEDMGRRPSQVHSIDRVNNSLGYFKENCRWATKEEQNDNRRNTLFVFVSGIATPGAKVARENNIPVSVFQKRIKAGWSVEMACKTPVRAKKPNKPRLKTCESITR